MGSQTGFESELHCSLAVQLCTSNFTSLREKLEARISNSHKTVGKKNFVLRPAWCLDHGRCSETFLPLPKFIICTMGIMYPVPLETAMKSSATIDDNDL